MDVKQSFRQQAEKVLLGNSNPGKSSFFLKHCPYFDVIPARILILNVFYF
jgi:hypothetical protein